MLCSGIVASSFDKGTSFDIAVRGCDNGNGGVSGACDDGVCADPAELSASFVDVEPT